MALCSVSRLALAGVVAAAALVPASAAAGFDPDQIEMDRAIQAADEYWRSDPQNHCLGHNGGTVDKVFPARHPIAAGYSVNGECGTIHVSLARTTEYTRWQFCTLVVHEYGHTIDYFHVDDPADIMYSKPVTAGLHPKVCDYPDPHFWLRSWSQTRWR
jgi:hypothetical protein